MNNRELLDLLIFGLTWLEESKGLMVPRRATMVYRTWTHLGKLTEAERRAISTSSLVPFAKKHHLEVVSGTRKPKKSDVEKLVGTSDKHLIALAIGRDGPKDDLFFGSTKQTPGYFLLTTDAGKAYANSQAARHRNTRDIFLSAWPEVRRSLGRQMGGMKKRAGAGQRSDATESPFGRGIPAAKISSDDWEW